MAQEKQELFPPLAPKLTQEELDALPHDMRAWIQEHEEEFRASIEEGDRMIEEWIAAGSPTPKTLEEARQMYLEWNFPDRVSRLPQRRRQG